MNPNMLPKVRSDDLTGSCSRYTCTLMLGSFGGIRCSPPDTVVPCHIPTIGKGVSTKVSDLFVAAGCFTCHELLDGRDPRGARLKALYPGAWHEQILRAMCITQSLWIRDGLLIVPDGEIV